MEKKKKEFDAVAWVRSVRDEHYRRWGHLPMDEYMKKIHEEAEKTELAKKFREKNQTS
jgi:hypothetical protein